jgi:hypothetical protein
MDLSLSDEQQMLKDTVARVAREHCSIEKRRTLRDGEDGIDRELWQQFSELGLLALPMAEEDGGFGGSSQDVMVVMEELGRGLSLEPYLVNVVICGGFLRAASDIQRAAHLPDLVAGETQWAFAFAEAKSRYNLADVSASAVSTTGGYLLDGTKCAVLNGHCADYLLVTARTSGGQQDPAGISLFIVDANSEGIERSCYPLVDGTRGADIQFKAVEVPVENLLGPVNTALPLVEDVVAQALVAMGAEAVGAMDALLEQTVEYTNTRQQFGQPIGKFQALQHRMADMYLQCQSLRSLIYYAAIARDEQRPDMLQAAAGLKVKLAESSRFVSQQAVQLHGGIGMTDELGISHYFKRLLLLSTLFGDAEHHLTRYLQA